MADILRFPDDSDAVHRQAVQSLFSLFETLCEGAVTVDRDARIVWMNEKYAALLGLADVHKAIGRPVEEVIPKSRMREVAESGVPILLDIMAFGERWFVVSRLPLRNDQGTVTGAVGFVLYDRPDYLKPLVSKFTRLQADLAHAERELARHRRAKYRLSQFIGNSPEVVEVRRQARRAAQWDSTLLLLGETGTGKELLAHAIHAASPRAQAPFVGVNMAAVPETMMEAEFFGVAPDADDRGGRRGHDGKFVLADGGTLFLDEIGDMPPAVQAKLLRVLQEREVEPVGSNTAVHVNVRVIAATSHDLEQRLGEGRFRADLYYRLNVLRIALPPLRQRTADIPALAEVFLEQIGAAMGRIPPELTSAANDVLAAYGWPGNVRELRNVLERVVALSDETRLTAEAIAAIIPAGHRGPRPAGTAPSAPRSLPALLADTERAAIVAALAAAGGRVAGAARALGISRSKLYKRMATLGLDH